jgi:hypothetical protein
MMFDKAKTRVRNLSAAIAALRTEDLYAIPHAELIRLREDLDRAAYLARSEGRDRCARPQVRKHLAALVSGADIEYD